MAQAIPIVDLSRFETTEVDQVAQELDQICREIGFLIITNHGVSNSIQDTLYFASREFFERPLNE